MKFRVAAVVCLFLVATHGEEEPEYNSFLDKLCVPGPIEECADCLDLLPQNGRKIISDCAKEFGININDNMKMAVEGFCFRDAARDKMFNCWEDRMDNLHETTTSTSEKKSLDEFQSCLENLVDRLTSNSKKQQHQSSF